MSETRKYMLTRGGSYTRIENGVRARYRCNPKLGEQNIIDLTPEQARSPSMKHLGLVELAPGDETL